MKIVVFGATGRTGQHVVQQALEAGHMVSVLVRNPARVSVQHERLQVVQGSLQDGDCVRQVISGSDAVISTLGPSSNQPTFEISQGMKVILAAMKTTGVRQLIISAGAGVGDPQDAPKLFNRVMNVLLKLAAKNVYEDMRKTVQLVRDSDVDWTVVRVPMLTDDPATGQIKVGMVGKGMGPRISRADLADFLLRQAQDTAHIRKAPAISN